MSNSPDMSGIVTDLDAEHADLDALVAGLDDAGWDTATPAEGWTVRDTISHLAFFDEQATLAAGEPDRFREERAHILDDLEGFMTAAERRGRAMTPAAVLAWWREARAASLAALRACDPKARLPWYGPDMSAVSFATARLMETWAHGQDVADALGVRRTPTARLRHICHIGARALPNSYLAHGREVPTAPVRLELVAPDGTTWTWGPEDAADRITGPALDFCLVVTQRRHRADTTLKAEGPVADEWLSIAQAFAGPPGSGRAPGMPAA